MPRGPKITQEEINKARGLNGEGKTVRQIAGEMNRSIPTVYKMLRPAVNIGLETYAAPEVK